MERAEPVDPKRIAAQPRIPARPVRLGRVKRKFAGRIVVGRFGLDHRPGEVVVAVKPVVRGAQSRRKKNIVALCKMDPVPAGDIDRIGDGGSQARLELHPFLPLVRFRQIPGAGNLAAVGVPGGKSDIEIFVPVIGENLVRVELRLLCGSLPFREDEFPFIGPVGEVVRNRPADHTEPVPELAVIEDVTVLLFGPERHILRIERMAGKDGTGLDFGPVNRVGRLEREEAVPFLPAVEKADRLVFRLGRRARPRVDERVEVVILVVAQAEHHDVVLFRPPELADPQVRPLPVDSVAAAQVGDRKGFPGILPPGVVIHVIPRAVVHNREIPRAVAVPGRLAELGGNLPPLRTVNRQLDIFQRADQPVVQKELPV